MVISRIWLVHVSRLVCICFRFSSFSSSSRLFNPISNIGCSLHIDKPHSLFVIWFCLYTVYLNCCSWNVFAIYIKSFASTSNCVAWIWVYLWCTWTTGLYWIISFGMKYHLRANTEFGVGNIAWLNFWNRRIAWTNLPMF